MGEFNKKEYDILYNSKHRDRMTLGMRKEEKQAFTSYCTKIGVKPTPYITKLINDDAIKRGYKPIFGSTTDGNKNGIE